MAKLFVICGHGAGDSGACGNGYQEQERVRVLGKRIKELGGDNVVLGDVNRNYYADNGIMSLNIPKDYQIVELHMDSSTVTTAKGAHVIINAAYRPDEYDKALADFFCGLFPGRSTRISQRSDLANPARAAAMGYPYRLIECGFISNAGDVKIFNANIDNMAKGILKCFGITPVESKPAETAKPTTVTPTATNPNRSTGALFTCTGLWTQATGGKWYPASQLLYGKGDYTIGKVHTGTEHPYEALKNGAIVGFANDKCIDDEPTLPGGASQAKPVVKTIKVGSKVKIRPGAVYGGSSSKTRGLKVPSEYCNKVYTVQQIGTFNGVKEALIKELYSWVAVNSLTLV